MTEQKISFETNELNYLFGGYFSAIGNLKINKRKRGKSTATYTIECCVFFNDMKFAKLFQKSFGGNIVKKKLEQMPKSFKSKAWRLIYWRVACAQAADFIAAIEPYIMDKRMKRRMKKAKAFYKYQQRHFLGRSETVRKQKHKYYLQMRRLR